MDAYEVLLNIHRIGSRISGTVVARDDPAEFLITATGHAVLQTDSTYLALLPYSNLVDQQSSFSPSIVPKVGTQVEAVVFNFVDGTLYLSAKPIDFEEVTICKWQQYYDYIDTLAVGSTIIGTIKRQTPFGLFVDIGGPFIGLIDIGHIQFSGGLQLPSDRAVWPEEGEELNCRVSYFRLRNQQIGLGWVPR